MPFHPPRRVTGRRRGRHPRVTRRPSLAGRRAVHAGGRDVGLPDLGLQWHAPAAGERPPPVWALSQPAAVAAEPLPEVRVAGRQRQRGGRRRGEPEAEEVALGAALVLASGRSSAGVLCQ
jgi:hypothetical protein